MDPYIREQRLAAAQRRTSFERDGQRDKAKKMLEVIDTSCKCLDIPIPCGESGVDYVMGLSASAMLNVRWAAKLKDPPSYETFGALQELIRERSAP